MRRGYVKMPKRMRLGQGNYCPDWGKVNDNSGWPPTAQLAMSQEMIPQTPATQLDLIEWRKITGRDEI